MLFFLARLWVSCHRRLVRLGTEPLTGLRVSGRCNCACVGPSTTRGTILRAYSPPFRSLLTTCVCKPYRTLVSTLLKTAGGKHCACRLFPASCAVGARACSLRLAILLGGRFKELHLRGHCACASGLCKQAQAQAQARFSRPSAFVLGPPGALAAQPANSPGGGSSQACGGDQE